MKSRITYQKERSEMAQRLEDLNNAACRHIARLLRLNDEQKRLSMELCEKPVDMIDQRFYEAVYRVLSFGEPGDKLTILTGNDQQIEDLIKPIIQRGGFANAKGFWVELP